MTYDDRHQDDGIDEKIAQWIDQLLVIPFNLIVRAAQLGLAGFIVYAFWVGGIGAGLLMLILCAIAISILEGCLVTGISKKWAGDAYPDRRWRRRH